MLTVPVVAIILASMRQFGDVAAVLVRLVHSPRLVAVLLAAAFILGFQQWLFGWSPQSGHGLDAALGYLLLPLVMVVLGVLIHRERLSVLRGGAVAGAVVGVVAAVVVAGGLSWVTLAIALGYPLYFLMRRHWSLDTSGALFLELLLVLPVAIGYLVAECTLETIAANPALIPVVGLFGLVSGVALVCYMTASRLLSFALFGRLSYIEPVLLVVVAVVQLGESPTPGDAFVYGPIVLALALLAVESARALRSSDPSVPEPMVDVGEKHR